VNESPAEKLLAAPADLDRFALDLHRFDDVLSGRVDLDPANVERGLARLVLGVMEVLRQLIERQALRRVEGGALDDDTIEQLGRTLMAFDVRMAELRDAFGLSVEELDPDLGELGRLL
jgi:hypothetical protein